MKPLIPCLLSFPVSAFALVLPGPDWAGEPDVIYVRFNFTTPSFQPEAEIDGSPSGKARGEVLVDSPFGTGWVDASDPDEWIVRRDGGGAWDLGPSGSISVSIPLWGRAEGEEGLPVEVFVNVVAFEGMLGAPAVSICGVEQSVFLEGGILENDPPFGAWRFRSWGGSLTGGIVGTLDVVVSADPGLSSFVDAVEIYIIPEPKVWALCLGVGAAGWVLAVRRWR